MISATHSWSGPVAVKSRSNRSAGRPVSAAGRVVRTDLSRSSPRSPFSRISRSTVHRATRVPCPANCRFSSCHRIKAVSTVVAGNMGTSFRSFQPDGTVAALDALAEARIEEARTGELTRQKWLPDTLEEAAAAGATDIDTTQAITYYRTERGGNEHSTNRRLSRGDSLLLGYDAFHMVEQLMTQPLQVILAGRKGNTRSYEAGMMLWEMAPLDLLTIAKRRLRSDATGRRLRSGPLPARAGRNAGADRPRRI